jgi:hypothetical protein
VWLFPFPTDVGFFLLAFVSVMAAGMLVGATVRRLGLPERHALAATACTCATSLTASCFWAHYVDVHMLSLYAGTVYLAVRVRRFWLVPLAGGGVLVKEIALLAVPLAMLIWGRRRISWPVVAMASSAATGILLLLYFLIPVAGAAAGGILEAQVRYSRIWLEAVADIGPVRYTGNALLSVFGLLWLLWPLGLGRAPEWLRRAQLWIPLTLPLFVTAQWERSFAYYLPIVVPVAMLALREAGRLELMLLTVASVWVSGVVSALTIGGDITPSTEKLLLMSPGLLIGGGIVARRAFLELQTRSAEGRVGQT